MDRDGNPEREVTILVDIVRSQPEETRPVELAAGALRRLLANCPGNSARALGATGALGALLRSMEAQHASARAQQVDPPSCPELAALVSDLIATSAEARMAALRDQAVQESLSRLISGGAQSRDRALLWVRRVLCLSAASTDRAAQQEFFSRLLVHALPAALQQRRSSSDGAAVLAGLLDTLAGCLEAEPRVHQVLFRGSDGYLQLATLLTASTPEDLPGFDPTDEGVALARRVLRVLRLAVAGSDECRQAARASVPYEALGRSLRGTVGSLVPREVLLDVFSLAAEVDLSLPLHQPEPAWEGLSVENADALGLCVACMLPPCDPGLQTWGLNALSALLVGRVRNLAQAQSAGLHRRLVSWLVGSGGDGADGAVAPPAEGSEVWLQLLAAVQVTGAFGTTSRDLRDLLTLLRARLQQPEGRPAAAKLLAVLRSLCALGGPANFFHLEGDKSGVLRCTPVRQPYLKGYSISLWLRPDEDPISAASTRSGPPRRRLQLLATLATRPEGSLQGICCVLCDGRLSVRSIGVRRGEMSLEDGSVLEPRQWYHVVIVHSQGGPLQPAVLSSYVNGQLRGQARLPYPKMSEPIPHVSFGAHQLDDSAIHGDQATREEVGPFHGELGGIHLMDGPLTPAQVSSLWSLGPDYQGGFLAGESSSLLEASWTLNRKARETTKRLTLAFACLLPSLPASASCSHRCSRPRGPSSLAGRASGRAFWRPTPPSRPAGLGRSSTWRTRTARRQPPPPPCSRIPPPASRGEPSPWDAAIPGRLSKRAFPVCDRQASSRASTLPGGHRRTAAPAGHIRSRQQQVWKRVLKSHIALHDIHAETAPLQGYRRRLAGPGAASRFGWASFRPARLPFQLPRVWPPGARHRDASRAAAALQP